MNWIQKLFHIHNYEILQTFDSIIEETSFLGSIEKHRYYTIIQRCNVYGKIKTNSIEI